MMELLTSLLERAMPMALLGSALVAGVFFAFSNFVMQALARLEPRAGIAAMQSINVTVLNRGFLGLFVGTALVAMLVALDAGLRFRGISSWLAIAGGLAYVVGTFMVTGLGNVPLNQRLAGFGADDSDTESRDAREFWRHYLKRWTFLNSVRTVAATCAAILFLAATILRAA